MRNSILLVISTLMLVSCANQLMKNSILLEPGMSEKELITILGAPDNRQFKGQKEAWQYCETGGMVDDYITVWLVDGKVAETQSYHNTQTGFCSSFFKTINWQDAPDTVIEVRNR